MLEMNWFSGKTNIPIYHIMQKKLKSFLADVMLKVNNDGSQIP
jgi:hypothetical protein